MNLERFSLRSAIVASIGATIALIFSMSLFGINITKSLGVTAGMRGFEAYLVGSILCFSAGIVYGLFYALFIEPFFKKLPKYLSGAIFSLLPFILSILFINTFLHFVRVIFDAEHKKEIIYQPEVPGEGSKGWFITLINHGVYGIVLGVLYKPKRRKKNQ